MDRIATVTLKRKLSVTKHSKRSSGKLYTAILSHQRPKYLGPLNHFFTLTTILCGGSRGDRGEDGLATTGGATVGLAGVFAFGGR